GLAAGALGVRVAAGHAVAADADLTGAVVARIARAVAAARPITAPGAGAPGAGAPGAGAPGAGAPGARATGARARGARRPRELVGCAAACGDDRRQHGEGDGRSDSFQAGHGCSVVSLQSPRRPTQLACLDERREITRVSPGKTRRFVSEVRRVRICGGSARASL